MFKWFTKKLRQRNIKQSCDHICYCPRCREPFKGTVECKMISQDGIYQYTCKHCGTVAKFHFGIAPIPIYIED